MKINKPVFSIILLIINLILVFLFVFPKYQDGKNLEMSFFEKQSEYDNALNYYTDVSEALKNIEERQNALGKIDSALPHEPSFSSLAYFLNQKADESGLIIKSITFSQTSREVNQQVLSGGSSAGIKNIVFTINTAGSYQGLKHFLFSLERSARLFEVNTISFASSEPSKNKGVLQNRLETYSFKLELKTYAY